MWEVYLPHLQPVAADVARNQGLQRRVPEKGRYVRVYAHISAALRQICALLDQLGLVAGSAPTTALLAVCRK